MTSALRRSPPHGQPVGHRRTAVIFYGFVLLGISVVTTLLWRYVARHRDLLESDVTDEDVRAMNLRRRGLGRPVDDRAVATPASRPARA